MCFAIKANALLRTSEYCVIFKRLKGSPKPTTRELYFTRLLQQEATLGVFYSTCRLIIYLYDTYMVIYMLFMVV